MRFSFIHTADIHLGRAFSDISLELTKEQNSILKTAHEDALAELVNFAINHSVDFILIAGDTFDDTERDLHSKLVLIKALKELEANNIHVFIICGNHDPINSYTKELSFKDSDKIHIFGVNTNSKPMNFQLNNQAVATIYPFGFTSSECRISPAEILPKATSKNTFNIGLIHCDITNLDNVYAPCSIINLKTLNYDYYALGHIHKPYLTKNIAYSGTIQARSSKDIGEHGFRLITVENNNITSNDFITCDKVRYYNYEYDVSNDTDEIETIENLSKELAKLTQNCKLAIINLQINGIKHFQIQNLTEFKLALSNDKLIINQLSDISFNEIKTNTIYNSESILNLILTTAFDENLSKEIIISTKNELKDLLKLTDNIIDDDILLKTQNDIKNLCAKIYYNNENNGGDDE